MQGPRSLWGLTGGGRKRGLTEIVNQGYVEAFHNDTCRDQDTPANGLGVEPDTLKERHVFLLLCGRLGVMDDLVHRLDMIYLLLVSVFLLDLRCRVVVRRGGQPSDFVCS